MDNDRQGHVPFERVLDLLLEGDGGDLEAARAHAEGCQACAAHLREAEGIIIALASPAEAAPDVWVTRARSGIRRAREEDRESVWAQLRRRAGVVALGGGVGATVALAPYLEGQVVSPVWAAAVVLGGAVLATLTEERIALD
jgi:hypothetical protein